MRRGVIDGGHNGEVDASGLRYGQSRTSLPQELIHFDLQSKYDWADIVSVV